VFTLSVLFLDGKPHFDQHDLIGHIRHECIRHKYIRHELIRHNMLDMNILGINLSDMNILDVNTLRTGSFKLFKCPFPGFLTILTL